MTTAVDSAPVRGPFALDLRGLAAFRIGIGVLLLTDLCDRWMDFAAHYGAAGALPRGEYQPVDDWHLSLHLWVPDPVAHLLFAAAVVLALLLAAGWRTRLVTLLSWVLLCSLHSRNHLVLQSGDTLLRMALFWGLFLPLGARWSVDAWLRAQPPAAAVVRTVATVALVAQLAAVYVVAVASKLHNPLWWRDGLGVHHALHVDQFTSALGVWVRGQTGLVKFLAYATLAIEALAPVLLLLPWRVPLARVAAAALVIPMHVGFALTMNVGLFSFIMVVWWLAVMPAGFWDRAARLAARLPRWRPPTSWWRWIRGGERGDPTVTVCRSRVAKGFVGAAAVYCGWWLAAASNPAFAMPRVAQAPARLLRLEQRWDMFARPPPAGGWYLAPGQTAAGRVIDLRTGHPPQWTRPELPSATLGSSRWIKYMVSLEAARRHQRWYLYWLCRRWNAEHDAGARVARVELVKMEQKTVVPRRKRPAPARTVMTAVDCD